MKLARLTPRNRHADIVLIDVPAKMWPLAIGLSPAHRIAVAFARMSLLLEVLRGMESGMSLNAAAKACGASPANTCKFLKLWRRDGLQGLMPNTHKCGRQPAVLGRSRKKMPAQLAVRVSARDFKLGLGGKIECLVKAVAVRRIQRKSRRALKVVHETIPVVWQPIFGRAA